MTSLFQRLDEEETIVRGELAALREKIAVTEERLARLTITRETAASLLGDSASTANSGGGCPNSASRQPLPPSLRPTVLSRMRPFHRRAR